MFRLGTKIQQGNNCLAFSLFSILVETFQGGLKYIVVGSEGFKLGLVCELWCESSGVKSRFSFGSKPQRVEQ